jgi:hypothetical protein
MWVLLLFHFNFGTDGQPLNEIVIAQGPSFETYEECQVELEDKLEIMAADNNALSCVHDNVFRFKGHKVSF